MLPAETGGTRVPQRLHGPDFVCFRCTQRDQSPRYSNNAVRTLPEMSREEKKSSFYASPWETGAVSSCWHQPWYVHCSLNLVDTNETSLGRSLAADQQTEVGDLSLTEPRRNRLRGRTDTNSATAPKQGSTRTPRAALRAPCHPQSLQPAAQTRSKAPGARYRRGTSTSSAPARPRPRRRRARGDRSGDRSAAAPRWRRWPQAPQGVCPRSSSSSPGKQQRSSRQPPDAPRQRSAKLAEPRWWFRSGVT